MRKLSVITFLVALLGILCSLVNVTLLFSIPKGWPKPVYDFIKNPLSDKKIQLGRKLFYDPILSLDSTISCSSCHSQYNAFTHVDHTLSHGIGGKIGTRNAPSLQNLAWQKTFMWDGAINHLDMQALAPMSNPVEMNENIQHVVMKLQRTQVYPKLFFSAYNDSNITGSFILKSISQFMITLVSANSKYDKVMSGKTRFTENELRGYHLFQKNCNTCHSEPLFTNNKFENNGLEPDTTLNDWGRMHITKKQSDSLCFKVPTLRNIEFSYPYMHDGRFKTLNQVLNHYIKGIKPTPTLGSQLKNGIELTADEKVDLISFLLTLSDKEFIFNNAFTYPRD